MAVVGLTSIIVCLSQPAFSADQAPPLPNPSSHASADGLSDVESLIREGLALRRAGRDEAALPLFQNAYEQGHTPRATAQLALCEQALGRWAFAEEHLLTALAATADPWIASKRPELEQQLAFIKAHVGRIEVVGSPVGASVLVNGRDVGKLPLRGSVAVDAGRVEVELTAEGHASDHTSVTVSGGQFQIVVLRLKATPGGADQPARASALVAGSPDRGPLVFADTSDNDAAASVVPVYKRTWFWIAAGGVAAAATTAILIATRSERFPVTAEEVNAK